MRDARAGGWVRGAGGLYARLGAGLYIGLAQGGQNAFLVGDSAPSGRFWGLGGELYADVGFGAGFGFELSARWADNRYVFDTGESRRNSGPEDLEFYAKWSPFSASHAFALMMGARVAMYERLSDQILSTGVPQRGAGGQDLLFAAAYGRSLGRFPAWIGIDVTGRIRLHGSSAAVRTRFELGSKLVGTLQGVALLELQPAFGRDNNQPQGGPAPITRVFGLGGKFLWAAIVTPDGKLGLSADFVYYPPEINDGPGYRVGLGATIELAAKARESK